MKKTFQQTLESDKTLGRKRPVYTSFADRCKRIVKDIEPKGNVRTAKEGISLQLYADHADTLMIECLRTFPTVRFDAPRAEIVTGKPYGRAVVVPMHHQGGKQGW